MLSKFFPMTQHEHSDEARYLAYVGRLRNLVRVGYRYLAFTSDLGEAVRPVVKPAIVSGAYAISFACMNHSCRCRS